MLVQLAQAVCVKPAGLCTVERETLRHLRIFTGRSKAQMGRKLGMSEATYRELENTGARGRLAASRYSPREGRWLAWEEWAAAKFAVTPDRLTAAEERTRADWQAERERRWQQLSEAEPRLRGPDRGTRAGPTGSVAALRRLLAAPSDRPDGSGVGSAASCAACRCTSWEGATSGPVGGGVGSGW
ncbi:hypothetical protein ABZ743_32735 [Streptomyces sp. NPDC006662]|uniref:hypothetical protein n=1 Tax=Streptomyces sp. NPDC006662 TaxID=3156902 RepID=UPI0033CF0653